MESPVIEEQLQELTYLYDIPKNLSEKIIIAIQNVTSADFGAFNRRFFVTVFVSANGGTISLLDRNWGLFRIERIGTLLESEQSQMRLVELYFYLEE